MWKRKITEVPVEVYLYEPAKYRLEYHQLKNGKVQVRLLNPRGKRVDKVVFPFTHLAYYYNNYIIIGDEIYELFVTGDKKHIEYRKVLTMRGIHHLEYDYSREALVVNYGEVILANLKNICGCELVQRPEYIFQPTL